MKAMKCIWALQLLIPLTIPLSLTLSGCGGGGTTTTGGTAPKTPDEVLKEAQAKDAAAKAAPK